MKKLRSIIIIFCWLLVAGYWSLVLAQQTPQYTQFMLNNYITNPAACGAYNNKIDAMMGLRRQWVGFDKPPTSSFANVTTYFGRKGGGFGSGWHGVGVYWQGDNVGQIIKSDDFYASYTYLMRTMRTGFLSFGMAAGARRYGFRLNETSDPVLVARNMWLYPDFIPGIKFFNNSWTFDLSVRQLYKYRIKQGGNQIGSPAKLPPHFYFSSTYKWWPQKHLLVIQSLQIKYNFSTLPSFDYGMLAYLNKNFAVGFSYRHFDAIAAILQYRFEKLVIGLAFDYAIAPYRVGFANSQELMLGLSPSPFNGSEVGTHYQTAECPKFQY